MFRFLGFRVERGLLIGRLGVVGLLGLRVSGLRISFQGGGGPKAWV